MGNIVQKLLIFTTFFYFVFPEEKEDLRTAFTQLEEQLEKMIDNQEQHYRKTYKRVEEAMNGTLPTLEQSPMNRSSTNLMYERLAESEHVDVDVLNEAMAKLEMRALDMLKNHAKIMAQETSIVEKVKEYEQNVDRVSKELKERDEVEKLLKKKDRIVAAKGTVNDTTTVRQKMSKLAGNTLLHNNDTNQTSLRGAISRLEIKVEQMIQKQADVLESQSSFGKVLDNVSEQLYKAYGQILGKKKDGHSRVLSTGSTEKAEWMSAKKFLAEHDGANVSLSRR